MMKIPIGDYKISEDERKLVNEVLDSNRISEWEKVRLFEKKWAEFIGTKYSVLLNSGTSALIAGLTALIYHKGLNVKEGKKVITTPITYISTSSAIIKSNLEPVYIDVDKKTFNITPENIKAHLECVKNIEDYSIILPVHLMGYACDMDKINKIAKDYNLLVFEDSSQAHGTVYKNKKVGSLSLLSAFSFYIAHNIQAGEMGAITTDDVMIVKLLRKIKANGRVCDCFTCIRSQNNCPHKSQDYDPRFTHDIIGYNFKTTEFQAALALAQLKNIDWIIKKRQENVRILNENLEKYSNLLELPIYSNKISYLAYPLVIKKPGRISRKKLTFELERNGIETRPLFGCIPTKQPSYSIFKEKYNNKLPNAEYIGLNAFYIGCHQYLNQNDLDHIIKTFDLILKGL